MYNIWRKNNTINNLHLHSNEYGSGCLKKHLLSSRNYSEHARKIAGSNLFIVGHMFYKAPVEVFLIAVAPSFGLWIWKCGWRRMPVLLPHFEKGQGFFPLHESFVDHVPMSTARRWKISISSCLDKLSSGIKNPLSYWGV